MFRNVLLCQFESRRLVAWSAARRFRVKNQAIGVKAPLPGFVEPALASSTEGAVRSPSTK
jgi:bifunctional non-homologous end joining protein LigD